MLQSPTLSHLKVNSMRKQAALGIRKTLVIYFAVLSFCEVILLMLAGSVGTYIGIVRSVQGWLLIAGVAWLLGLFIADRVVARRFEASPTIRSLMESKQRYQSLFEHHPDAVYSLDNDGYCLNANHACEQLTGYTAEELRTISFAEIVSPHEAQRAQAMFDIAKTGVPVTDNTKIIRKDGSTIEINDIMIPIVVADTVVGVYGISRDVTEKIRTSEALRKSEEQYRMLYEQLPVMYMTLDDKGTVLTANPAAMRALAVDEDDLLGASILSYVHPEDYPFMVEVLQQQVPDTMHHYQRIQYRLQPKRHPAIWVEQDMRVTSSSSAGDRLFHMICTDITNKRNAERLLEGQKQVLERIAKGEPLTNVLDTIIQLVETTTTDTMCTITLPNTQLQIARHGSSNKDYGANTYIAAATESLLTDIPPAWTRPIIGANGNTFGILTMCYTTPKQPDTYDLQVLEGYAYLAGLAIERDRNEKEISDLSFTDQLTKLPNARYLMHHLPEAIEHAGRTGTEIAIMLLDVDRFKAINDTLGHNIGDMVLMDLTARIQSCIDGTTDMIVRMSGDEFIIVLQNISESCTAVDTAARILRTVEQPVCVSEQNLRVTASIGIAFYPRDGQDSYTLLKHADIAMYRAKESGKNNVQIATPNTNNEMYNWLRLESDLSKALDNQEFVLHYQPRVSLDSGIVTSAEALVRWNHPTLGLIPPAAFISLAEETGLIIPLGVWVLNTALRQALEWEAQGLPPLRVAVNVSARQFLQNDLVDSIRNAFAHTGALANRLEIEITESILMANIEEVSQRMQALRDMGVTISIDDFGVGYSSLSYLKRLPVDTLKIDQSFVRDIPGDENDSAIVTAITALSRSLGMTVVAEGVETESQKEFLQSIHCHEMQGYLFSKPLPAREFVHMFRTVQMHLKP